ncbi:MAG: helix-turn-helix transcriptional regulator [Oscillospiraceae bacterium]|nr:helix-turn-helix transcriptional regulator [Oscillospiraceae bacterium]
MSKSSYASYSDDRYHSAFARVLREELLTTSDDVKGLAEFLQISPQAVNQFKQGQSFPKTENLVKMAQYFRCSLDYLIGLSDVRSPDADLQTVCDYTGLSEKAVSHLHASAEEVKRAQEQDLPETPNEIWLHTVDRLLQERLDLFSDIGKYLFTDFSGFLTNPYVVQPPLEKVWVRTVWGNMELDMPLVSQDAEELLLRRIQNKLRELRPDTLRWGKTLTNPFEEDPAGPAAAEDDNLHE